MDDKDELIGMGLGSWLVGAATGALAAVMLWVLGGWSFMQGAFMGVLIALIVGGIVAWVMTRPLSAPGEASVAPATPGETAAKVAKAPPTVEANKGRIKPTSPLPGQAELASRKGEWTYKGDAAAEPTPIAPAPAGDADDLKLISGIGPALEKKLNDAGITRFEQIANLSAAEAEKIEEQLRFKGRMERDDWFGQAKILAAGGETEFSKKKR